MGASLPAACVVSALLAAVPGQAAAKGRGGPIADPYMPIETCAEKLAAPVDALLKPMLLALAKASWAKRLYDPTFERQLQALLRSKHPRALEAQVAALAYYLGDQAGEQMLAQVLAQGGAADELVARYRTCRPPTSFDAKLFNLQTSTTKYQLFDEERRRKR
jgi:hypothetical protein